MKIEQNIIISEEEKLWVGLLSQGKSTKEVSEITEMPTGTFASKIRILRAKFNCPNTTSLVALFVKNGLV
jgi:DNA-binding CsgD family transcriptional regulator